MGVFSQQFKFGDNLKWLRDADFFSDASVDSI
jgi:hypothetical protein